jgi:multimeric flavodoxin WrbA
MLKRVLAFNGSGRKTWNTAQLASRFLDGARSAGATVELVHLSDLKFRGCQGCLSCKLVGTPQYSRCAVKDDLTKYLRAFYTYDVVAFATPIFFMAESAMMRSCLERVMFQYTDYDPVFSKYPGKTKIAYLATMNIDQAWLDRLLKGGCTMSHTQDFLTRIFGNCTPLYVTDTWQVEGYEKYHINTFDEGKKRARREQQFPIDLQKAFDLGVRLVNESR